MTKDSLSQFIRSRLFAGIALGVAIMLVLVCVFEAGVALGYHEAVFSSHWGANYEHNFGGSDMQGQMGLPDGHGPETFGAIGQIISVASSTMVVQNNDQQEEKVIFNGNTVIRNQENTIPASSLSSGTYVVVVGTPDNQGTIDASLIRVIPSPTSPVSIRVSSSSGAVTSTAP